MSGVRESFLDRVTASMALWETTVPGVFHIAPDVFQANFEPTAKIYLDYFTFSQNLLEANVALLF